MSAGFGETPTPPYLDTPPPVAELDRSLSLRDRDRVVATAGVYSRSLTIPGAVVPCAGVTWVTVAPPHRRHGVLTAIMRRQLTEIHEQQREPVAALWASEYPIYSRFGYAPATPRAQRTGPTARLRLRPDVDLGSGRVDFVDEDVYRPAAAAPPDGGARFVPGHLAGGGRAARRRAPIRTRQPGARRPLGGPPDARPARAAARRDRTPLPAAHRDRRHGDRLRRLPVDAGLDRDRPAGHDADRRGGPGRQHRGVRLAVAGPALGGSGGHGADAQGLPGRPPPPPGHRRPGPDRPGAGRPVGPARRRGPCTGRSPLSGSDRPGDRGQGRVLPLERRPLAAGRPSRRWLLRAYRSRSRPRPRHRGALRRLPRRDVPGDPAGCRAGEPGGSRGGAPPRPRRRAGG